MVYGMKNTLIRITFLLLMLVLAFSQGCSTCNTRVVDVIKQGELSAELDFRVCGMYSGYSVAIYSNKNGSLKSGEGEKEPFKALYKSKGKSEYEALPISIEWVGDKRLLIRHQTKTGIDDVCELMILKAETEYLGVGIEYEPAPVVWR
jgi:hypothetical protein